MPAMLTVPVHRVLGGRLMRAAALLIALLAVLAAAVPAHAAPPRRGYLEASANGPRRTSRTRCAHPIPGTPDGTQQAAANDQYATRHHPFVYFHSIIDAPARCAAGDVPLSRLTGDLASVAPPRT